jgi:zinc transporter ZupT
MDFIPIIFSLLTFVSTFAGGIFAMRNKSKIHYIMAFAAGVLIGVVSFDIFPEIIELVKTHNFNSIEPMIALVAGFLLFHFLEKGILIQHCHGEDCKVHKHPHVGVLSALALAGHSFMDGLGIGFGFQVSSMVGILVAIAVISHDFTDGMNTVTMMLSHKNSDKKAKAFLYLDAITPILGAVSTLFFTVTPHFLVLYLGFFAGFLLYIGASDVLPEAHSEHSSYSLMGLTTLGVILIFVISRLA